MEMHSLKQLNAWKKIELAKYVMRLEMRLKEKETDGEIKTDMIFKRGEKNEN